MMQNQVAKKYSQALFNLAEEEGQLLDSLEEINQVWQVFTENDELRDVIFHPRILPGDKKNILKKIFAKELSAHVFNFLKLLVDHRRIFFLKSIVKEYNRLVNQQENILEVKVTSAIELDKDLKDNIRKKLEKELDYKIILEDKVDPDIIGGLILKIGDHIIDGSIQHELNSLHERIKQIPVSKLGVD
ncbi:MAG: F0F1 ATP synthase subunit delta [Bacillota bacterium]